MNYIEDIASELREQIDPDLLPDEHGMDDLFRLYALLVLTTGTQTTLENVHDAWSAWMVSRDADHESIEPYGDLDPTTRSEDEPFQRAIVAVAERRPA